MLRIAPPLWAAYSSDICLLRDSYSRPLAFGSRPSPAPTAPRPPSARLPALPAAGGIRPWGCSGERSCYLIIATPRTTRPPACNSIVLLLSRAGGLRACPASAERSAGNSVPGISAEERFALNCFTRAACPPGPALPPAWHMPPKAVALRSVGSALAARPAAWQSIALGTPIANLRRRVTPRPSVRSRRSSGLRRAGCCWPSPPAQTGIISCCVNFEFIFCCIKVIL